MGGRLLIGAALLCCPAAALACSCLAPEDASAAAREQQAHWLARPEIILLDAERIDDGGPGPQHYRVYSALTGTSPGSEVRIYPRFSRMPDGTRYLNLNSCEFSGTKGVRRLTAFIVARRSDPAATCGVLAAANDSGLSLLGICTQYALDDPRLVARVVALRQAQAGVSRSSRPVSSSK